MSPALCASCAPSITSRRSSARGAKTPELLKAMIEGIDYTWTQREATIEIIGKWMKLNPVQAAKAYDSVRDAFSKIGVPTEEQAKAYIAMLSSTASLKGDVAAGSISDFCLAAEAARE